MDFQNNKQLQLAYDFVQFTGKNIFLTGKAGTGKTTFLHYLSKHLSKRLVVVAPTGVAAINAAGVTIHSFFQLSFGPQLPEFNSPEFHRKGNEKRVNRFSKEKRNIIKSMDLLVIDEISMVRSDLLDGIDATLRRFRNRNLPFGGVQLLMIGDLQQLTPVVKENEWNLLSKHYDTPFFFSSNALKLTQYVTVELQHVYRQKDEGFIRLLNKIRNNQMDETVIGALNVRYKPDFQGNHDEGYIILTTHNYKAKDVNDFRLNRLQGKTSVYEAQVDGNFPEYNYPTDSELRLKEGAQVMFVKNDPDTEKRFYNGKIGTVTTITADEIMVKCPEEESPISVVPVEWQKMKYSLNEETKEISEVIEGTFTQLPLKTAWAITIHKSQGLTFEKAIIDAQAAFAHGQVYVALSRCKSLEGLVLSTPITTQSIKHDQTVDHFTRYFENNQPDKEALEKSQKEYQEQLIKELFDFQMVQRQIYYLLKLTKEHADSFQTNLSEVFREMGGKVKEEITIVSEKFWKQIKIMLTKELVLEKNDELQERIQKASIYFSKKVKELIIAKAKDLVIDTDNKAVRKLVNDALERMVTEAYFKETCLLACKDGFEMKTYLEVKAKASIDEKSVKSARKKSTSYSVESIPQPELYNRLREWRNVKAKELNVELYMVLPLKSMKELSIQMPGNLKSLKKINGFGKKRIATFGAEILDIIKDYCEENNLEPPISNEPEIIPQKNTKQITFELWNSGKNIQEIAKERGLTGTTIEGHLAYYVGKGEISVDRFVDIRKLLKIAGYFQEHKTSLMSEAKGTLGEEVSYSDIRFVTEHLKCKGVIDEK